MNAQQPEVETADRARSSELLDALGQLQPRQRRVVVERFGLDGVRPRTLEGSARTWASPASAYDSSRHAPCASFAPSRPGSSCICVRSYVTSTACIAERCEAAERLEFDLADAFARQPEPSSDLLERLRLRARQPVAHHDDLAFALGEGGECMPERLAAQVVLDRLLRQRLVTGHEVAEDGVLAVSDGRVEARRGARCGRTSSTC